MTYLMKELTMGSGGGGLEFAWRGLGVGRNYDIFTDISEST